MSYTRLRSASKYGTIVGMFLLSFGVFLFLISEEGTKPEKVGIVFMTYGGLMIGMAYTAFIALKTKL